MTTEEVMRERVMLLVRKHSHGLTADEAERLDWLTAEARRLCPCVTPEMQADMEAFLARAEQGMDRAARKANALNSG